jgi:hypothetical protein
MKVNVYEKQKSGIEVCVLLEPQRQQDFLRWLRNNDVKPPREWYANYDGELSLGFFLAPQHVVEQLQKWAELEKHKHE